MRCLKERTRRLYAQGASIERLWQYVSRWGNRLWGEEYGRVSRTGGVETLSGTDPPRLQHIIYERTFERLLRQLFVELENRWETPTVTGGAISRLWFK